MSGSCVSCLAGGLAGWSEGEYLPSYHRAALAHTTSMTRFRSFTLFLFLVLISMLPSACARPSENASALSATTSPLPAVDSEPAGLSQNASLSIQDIETNLLRFAASLKQPSDMSYRRVEEILGIRFEPPKDLAVSRRVLKSLPLAHGYTLYVSHSPQKKGYSFSNLLIGLPDQQDPALSLNAQCVWNAAEFSKKLEAMGYTRGGQRPFQGGMLRQHWRPVQNGAQGFSVALMIYETNDGGAKRECVYGAQIDGGDA